MIKKTVDYIRVPKRLIIATVTIVAGWGLYSALKPKQVPVDLTVAKQGPIERTLTEEGLTRFKDKVIITAPADGILPTHEWQAGDKIKKGQSLVTFMWDRNQNLVSPLDGYVLKVFEKNRRHVLRGTPLFEVGSPAAVDIVARFLTEDAVYLKHGQEVRITKWGGSKTLTGEVKFIEPSATEEVSALGVKEQRVNVIIDITSPREDWQNIGDGYRTEVQVILSKKDSALIVPIGTLFEADGLTSVFVVNSGKVELRSVEIGDRNRDSAEIIKGLSSGQQLVLYPGADVKEGTKVYQR